MRNRVRRMEVPAGKSQTGTADDPAGRPKGSRLPESPGSRSIAGPHPPAAAAERRMAPPASRFRDSLGESRGSLEMMVEVTRIIPILIAVLTLALAGCGEKAPEAKRYPIQGEVKALDANVKTATIAHGPIGDWMGAMTMEFPVKPDSDFQKLHVGDRIEATVVVEDLKYYVTGVNVSSAARR